MFQPLPSSERMALAYALQTLEEILQCQASADVQSRGVATLPQHRELLSQVASLVGAEPAEYQLDATDFFARYAGIDVETDVYPEWGDCPVIFASFILSDIVMVVVHDDGYTLLTGDDDEDDWVLKLPRVAAQLYAQLDSFTSSLVAVGQD